jgi:ferredoxin
VARALRLDPIRCDGYGMCAVVLPERVTLDDWGYPVIEPGPIPDHLLPQARRAVDLCPVLALRLRTVDSAQGGTGAPAGKGPVKAGT